MSTAIYNERISLPNYYTDVKEDEMYYIEGGIAWTPIIVGYISTVGLTYGGGKAAGKRAYYAGLRNPVYQKQKGKIRTGVMAVGVAAGPVGTILAGSFMLGFENGFYEMVS